jgi:hypothetical protein
LVGPDIRSGRSTDVEGITGDPNIIYAAFATGGLWKTEDAGNNWKPIFDNEATQSIGDITVTADSITRGRIISVNGVLRLTGSMDRTGTLTAESHGGDVELTLTTKPGFEVVATAIGGSITNSLNRTAPRQVRDGRSYLLEALIGEGGGTVTVTSFKGTIRLTPR